MNNKWVKQQIIEAKEQIEYILDDLDSNDYDLDDLQIELQHVYSHLNIAYNTAEWDEGKVAKFSKDDFNEAKKIPKDLILLEI